MGGFVGGEPLPGGTDADILYKVLLFCGKAVAAFPIF